MSPKHNDDKKAFLLLLCISCLTKIADLLVSPKTTLPYILTAGGAPSWLISLLVPIKESGSLLPQWLLKSHLSGHFENRTALWRIGTMLQGFGVLTMVLIMFFCSGKLLAYSVLLLLALVSFGRAICSLTMKDMEAETIEKGKRGHLIGLASSLSGGLTLISAIVFILSEQSLTHKISYGLLLTGGFAYLFSMIFSIPLKVEYQVADSLKSAEHFWTLLKHERNLRHLIISRILLMQSALIVPFIVASTANENAEGNQLAYFLGLSALASLISSYVWGILSDKGAVLTLRIATLFSVIASFAVSWGIEHFSLYMIYTLFFILTLGHAGIRTGRKTYLLDITERNNRSGYVAAANTCVGIGLLAFGAIYAGLFNLIGNQLMWLLSALLCIGLAHSYMLEKEK
ncbi:MFS transporter [Aliiglaciecola lipolytica]|uniref:Major facilitator superfamily permease n=1 Tax=Aliiglaciecola lipolytica E3 TaxID=1127673 RepID=K6YEW9_9ALTE|nr:MFS transporter [Aliiglaciecola lipolytica]GAC16712.1 major facilitator superfamily permease [Aliiglaciecola lipolytica E3]